MSLKNKKILVFTVASWNSKVGANSWATLLEGYDSKNVANICIREEQPDSKVCSAYFVVSENRMIKSLFNRKVETGYRADAQAENDAQAEDLEQHNERYRKMSKKRSYAMLLARELIWKLGKWHTKALDEFLDEFQPDIILHSMDGYIHLNRIIEYALKRTGAKAAGYIWDDNFTYKQSNKTGYKVYRFFQRVSLKSLAKKTSAFFAIATKTKQEADEFFGINCHLLTKPINTLPAVNYGKVGDCIKILYTGNLYIGREYSLLKVVNAVKNHYKGRFFVDVYTNSQMDAAYLAQIDPEVCQIHDPIPQSEVLKKQKEADVLLFLEDIDGPDAKVARLSFSTKITDYLSSGRCIVAVGNPDTAPMQYFKENNAAFTCGDEATIVEVLGQISKKPQVLANMAQNAANAGQANHNPEHIQSVFDGALAKL